MLDKAKFSRKNVITIVGILGIAVYALLITAVNNSSKSIATEPDVKTVESSESQLKPNTVKPEVKSDCIDVKKIYEQANVMSKGTTGVDQSIDTLKRNDLAATLITLTGVVYGNDIFCMDEQSRASLSQTERLGLLGSVESQVYSMSTNTPQVDVVTALKREFIPGANEQSTSAYAQSGTSTVTGYNYLKDQLKLDVVWEFFKNIAYIGFVLVLIITGFMIMFRTKLSGQVYVSITNSIPNIVVGLVLVTFSFAIVGLVLDTGKLMMNVTRSSLEPIFQKQGVSMVGIQSIGEIYGGAMDIANPNSGLEMVAATAAFAGAEAVLYLNADVDTGVPIAEAFVDGAATTASAIAKATAAAVKVASIADIIKILVIGAVCLYAAVKVFFTLLVTYIKIFLDLILSPIYILIGSFPGNSHVIKDWFKRLISYALTFVIVFLILNLARYIALSTNITADNLNFFGTSTGVVGWFIPINAIIVIVSYLIASTAPALVNSFMDVKTSQGITQILGDVKKSAGKLPVVGGMFGS